MLALRQKREHLRGRAVRRSYGLAPGWLGGKPFTTVNLAKNCKVSDQVTAFGRIDNLFNVLYENQIGLDVRDGVFAVGCARKAARIGSCGLVQ